MRKFDFLLIGAQKSGTSWLWDKLDQHPETDLPVQKEIHYFGGVELYRQGPEWYYEHFANLDSNRITGEASTSYLFDRIPYWHNQSSALEYDADLNTIPELVAAENPGAKIIVVLRDPVRRAISAYRHWTKKGLLSPGLGLRRTAIEHPKMRILEYGFYAQHLAAWYKVFPREQMQVLIFEDDIRSNPKSGLRTVYAFLDLNPDFQPADREEKVHKSWSWTRSAVRYYAGPFRRFVNHGPFGDFLDRNDFLKQFSVTKRDVRFLRDSYLPEKASLEEIIGRNINAWDYGEGLLA